jgi:hypothetical protein
MFKYDIGHWCFEMKTQIFISGLTVFFVLTILSGCNQIDRVLNPEEHKFVGTWVTDDKTAQQDMGKTLVFSSDGTVMLKINVTGTFEVDPGNYLIINISTDGAQIQNVFDYEFSNNQTTLRLLSQNTGRIYTYTRQ